MHVHSASRSYTRQRARQQGRDVVMHLQVSECTLHMIPDDDLNRSHLAFASAYVEERVIHRLLSSARTALESFLVSSQYISELAVLRGRLFEAFVHRILPLGGTFDIRDLETGKLTRIQ